MQPPAEVDLVFVWFPCFTAPEDGFALARLGGVVFRELVAPVGFFLGVVVVVFPRVGVAGFASAEDVF